MGRPGKKKKIPESGGRSPHHTKDASANGSLEIKPTVCQLAPVSQHFSLFRMQLREERILGIDPSPPSNSTQ